MSDKAKVGFGIRVPNSGPLASLETGELRRDPLVALVIGVEKRDNRTGINDDAGGQAWFGNDRIGEPLFIGREIHATAVDRTDKSAS